MARHTFTLHLPQWMLKLCRKQTLCPERNLRPESFRTRRKKTVSKCTFIFYRVLIAGGLGGTVPLSQQGRASLCCKQSGLISREIEFRNPGQCLNPRRIRYFIFRKNRLILKPGFFLSHRALTFSAQTQNTAGTTWTLSRACSHFFPGRKRISSSKVR